MKPRARRDARDDGGLLRDVRRAVPVRRHLGRAGRRRPRAGDGPRARCNEKLFGGANSVGKRVRWNDSDSASSACATTGCRCRRSTTSTTALRGAGGRLHAVRLERGARARQRTATPTAGRPRTSRASRTSWTPSASGSRCGSSCRTPPRSARFHDFLDNYATEQKKRGRYPRPLNNHLTKSDEWLAQRRRRATTTACSSASRSPSSRCAC